MGGDRERENDAQSVFCAVCVCVCVMADIDFDLVSSRLTPGTSLTRQRTMEYNNLGERARKTNKSLTKEAAAGGGEGGGGGELYEKGYKTHRNTDKQTETHKETNKNKLKLTKKGP